MPFDNDGNWVAPNRGDTEGFVESLLSPRESVVEIPDDLKQHLIDGMRQRGIRRTMHNIYDSICKAVNGGTGKVDIVIPVYSGLNVLKPCMDSIIKNTYWPHNLILVDDATPDDKVPTYLSKLTNATVLTNKKNRGFAASVNRGIKAGTGKYICVCNSDILVTPKWLLKMVMAIEADKTFQLVNPVTNNTALISVPMKPGASYLDMNRLLEEYSPRRYPEIMPTGFCLFMRRSLLEEIGYFDEGFTSYGEDSAFWVETMQHVKEDGTYSRYKAVLADDTYIFHERSSSFSAIGDDKHMGFRHSGSNRFREVYSGWKAWNSRIDKDKALSPLKQDIPPDVMRNRKAKYRVAYVVRYADMCGGMKFVADIVNGLIEYGVDAKIVVIKREDSDESVLQALRTQPIFFDKWEDCVEEFPEKVFDKGIVVASTGEVIKLVNLLKKTYPKLTTVHHAQSDDVALAPDRDSADKIARDIGKLDHTVASSLWVAQTLGKRIGKKPRTIHPGVDLDLFYPRGRHRGDDRPTVMIPMFDNYPYKGYDRGVELINAIAKKADGEDIRILVCGASIVPEAKAAIGLGFLSQGRLAEVLGTEVDVFCDPSHIHAYGMPVLEAAASGVFALSWENMGTGEMEEFCHALPSDATPEDMANVILGYLRHIPAEGEVLQPDFSKHNRCKQVKKFIKYYDSIAGILTKPKNIVVVSPHIRKRGGPTTLINTTNELAARGHKASMALVYSDINPTILESCKFPVNKSWENIRPCDVAIVNSDNDRAPQFFDQKQIKKLVMLKLSHNPRFRILENENLNLPWDHIMTSTEWLRQACLNPTEPWTHKAWDKDQVTRVGWYHYDHSRFDVFNNRNWGSKDSIVTIGFLLHTHPLKGTQDAIDITAAIKDKYGDRIHVISIGDMDVEGMPPWIQHFGSPSRSKLSKIMAQTDIWLSCSHTEGLGRMNLEAMSAGCAIVATNTGAEFLTHLENSLIFQVGDKEAGIECVDVLFNDTETTEMFRKAGYKTACAAADPSNYIRNIERVLENV